MGLSLSQTHWELVPRLKAHLRDVLRLPPFLALLVRACWCLLPGVSSAAASLVLGLAGRGAMVMMVMIV